jgi:F-type H+-transporting ATPase subunit delta
MLMEQLVQKYAQALYELAAEKKQVMEVETQLSNVAQIITSHGQLATFLYHPRVPMQAKKSLLKSVFGEEVSVYVLHFLLLIVDKRRESLLPHIIEQFVALANEARNIAIAKVTTFMPLSDSEQVALTQKLAVLTGKNIRLQIHTDPSIIGGVIVRLGDKLIDGSVKRQLDRLKVSLLNSQVTKIGVTN